MTGPFTMALLCATVSLGASPVVVSVKVIKAQPGRCSATPTLEVLEQGQAWQSLEEETFRGENDWEAYWNLETAALPTALPEVRVTCPGVKVSRVIVGRTDVPFEVAGEEAKFRLVADTSRGQLIETVLDDPEGGLPIYLHHNWEMRREREYKTIPWPARQIAAHNNFLFAAREALKFLGGFSPRNNENPFDGRIVLEGHETAATRGHMDFPPHFHIMLYPPGYIPGAQVPHFYLDEQGRVQRNSFVGLGIPGSGRTFGPGEWCSMVDLQGKVGLELKITASGGLALRKGPGDEELVLEPDSAGAATAVCVWQGTEKRCRCSVVDDAARGHMTITIDHFKGGVAARTSCEELGYDPFTGKIQQRRRSNSG